MSACDGLLVSNDCFEMIQWRNSEQSLFRLETFDVTPRFSNKQKTPRSEERGVRFAAFTRGRPTSRPGTRQAVVYCPSRTKRSRWTGAFCPVMTVRTKYTPCETFAPASFVPSHEAVCRPLGCTPVASFLIW